MKYDEKFDKWEKFQKLMEKFAVKTNQQWNIDHHYYLTLSHSKMSKITKLTSLGEGFKTLTSEDLYAVNK